MWARVAVPKSVLQQALIILMDAESAVPLFLINDGLPPTLE